jgi:hypothetical protein
MVMMMTGAMDRSFNPLVAAASTRNSSSSSCSSSSSGAERAVDQQEGALGSKDKQSPPEELSRQSAGEMSDVNFCFQYLLLCVAALESFAHGANDTANSTAAFRCLLSLLLLRLLLCVDISLLLTVWYCVALLCIYLHYWCSQRCDPRLSGRTERVLLRLTHAGNNFAVLCLISFNNVQCNCFVRCG